MSIILGIDTSSIDLGVGLFSDSTPVASYSRFVRNSHAEHLSQTVSMMLQTNSIMPSEISHIAVSNGPGSFTGLRIGLAFVKGFCTGRTIPVLPISSLQILAHAALRREGSVVAAVDARNDEIFWAEFSFSDWTVSRVTEDRVDHINDFINIIKPQTVVVTDTMGYLKSTVFTKIPDTITVLPIEHHPLQRGFYCARQGSLSLENNLLWRNAVDLTPDYLRVSAAQRTMKVNHA